MAWRGVTTRVNRASVIIIVDFMKLPFIKRKTFPIIVIENVFFHKKYLLASLIKSYI